MRIRRLLSTWRALTDHTANNGHSAAHTGTACNIRSAHSATGSACGGDDDEDDDDGDDEPDDEPDGDEETNDDEDEEVDAAGAGAGARNGGVRAAARSSGDDAVNALSSSLPLLLPLVSVLVTAVSDGSMRTNVYSTRSRHAIAITRCCERKRKNERITICFFEIGINSCTSTHTFDQTYLSTFIQT